jgi:hypothetical protein
MALDFDNYTNLQTVIQGYLNRSDMAELIPVWIALAEAQITRELRRTTVRATWSLFGSTHTLPAAVAELRSIRLVTSSTSQDTPLVNCGTTESLAEFRAQLASTGRPTHFAIAAGELLLAPSCDRAYAAEVTYFAKYTPLSDDAPTNALLTEAPDVLLFGALKEAAPYLVDDERIPLWEAKYNQAIASLNTVRVREENSASLRPARLPRTF